MNKNQKYVLVIGIILIVSTLIYWLMQGAEIFTKTKVLVDKTTDLDRMLGVENRQYVNHFMFGFLPSGFSFSVEFLSVSVISGILIVISGILIYLFKTKQKESI